MMKYFEVQLETKSHTDAPNGMSREIMMGHSRAEIDEQCQRMKGIESWNIMREMTQEQVKAYYGD